MEELNEEELKGTEGGACPYSSVSTVGTKNLSATNGVIKVTSKSKYAYFIIEQITFAITRETHRYNNCALKDGKSEIKVDGIKACNVEIQRNNESSTIKITNTSKMSGLKLRVRNKNGNMFYIIHF